MVQDNQKISDDGLPEDWAFVIDDRVYQNEPKRTPEEQKAYDDEIDRVLATIDFDNL